MHSFSATRTKFMIIHYLTYVICFKWHWNNVSTKPDANTPFSRCEYQRISSTFWCCYKMVIPRRLGHHPLPFLTTLIQTTLAPSVSFEKKKLRLLVIEKLQPFEKRHFSPMDMHFVNWRSNSLDDHRNET